MFIGHLPAGYLLTTTLQKKLKTSHYLLIGLIASVFPDIDILYFYLVDNRQNLHHSYWIHVPFYWLIIGIIAMLGFWLIGKKRWMVAAGIFFINIFLHLALDTLVGKIEWLFPFTERAYYLFDVPAVYDFWVYNFVFHWTFLPEIALVLLAIYRLNKNLKIRLPQPPEIQPQFADGEAIVENRDGRMIS